MWRRAGIDGFRPFLAALAVLFLILFGADQTGILRNLSFEYAPYFIFGGAWYYLLNSAGRSRIMLTCLLVISAVAMICQQEARVSVAVWYARDPACQMALLVGLAIAFCILSTRSIARSSRWRGLDGKAGDLTFAVYLNHQTVLTAMSLCFAPGWLTFLGGIVLSGAFSFVVRRTFEPPIARLRDRVRGTTIRGTSLDPSGYRCLLDPTSVRLKTE